MSIIQYLVYPYARALIEKDWSGFLAQGIRSVASPKLIDELCQPEVCNKIEQSIELVPTMTVTSTATVTSIITRTYLTIPQPSAVVRGYAVFKDIPGLTLHPLTLLFIFLTFLLLFSFGCLGICMHKVRSKRKARQAAIIAVNYLRDAIQGDIDTHSAHAQFLAESLQDTQDQVARIEAENAQLRQAISTSPKLELQVTDLTKQNAQLIEDLHQLTKKENDNGEVQQSNKVPEQHNHATLENEKLQRTITRLTIEKEDLVSDHVAQQKTLLTKLTSAEAEIKKLEETNASLILAHTKQIESLTSNATSQETLATKLTDAEAEICKLEKDNAYLQDKHIKEIAAIKSHALQNAQDSIAAIKAERDALESKYTTTLQSLNQKVTDAVADTARLEDEKEKLIKKHSKSFEQLQTKLLNADTKSRILENEKEDLRTEVFDCTKSLKELEIKLADAVAENKSLKNDNDALLASTQNKNNDLERGLRQQIATLEAEKEERVSDHTKSLEVLKTNLAEAIAKGEKLEEENSDAEFEKQSLVVDIEHLNEQIQNATADIKRLEKLNNDLVSQSADAAEHCNTADDQKKALIAKHNTEIQFFQGKLNDATKDVARLHEEKSTLESQHTVSIQSLQKNLADVTTELGQLKTLNSLLKGQVQQINSLRTELATLQKTIGDKDNEIAALQATNQALSQNTNEPELEDLRRIITARDQQITFLQSSRRILEEDVTKARGESKVAASNGERLQNQVQRSRQQIQRMENSIARLQGDVKQRDDALTTVRGELAQKLHELFMVNTNYTYVNPRYETAKKVIEQLQSDNKQLSDQTQSEINAAVNDIKVKVAKKLGVSYDHVQFSTTARNRLLNSKAVQTRIRSIQKSMNHAALRHKAANGRRHSVSFGETRMQVGGTLPERSSHLMTAGENRHLDAVEADQANIASSPAAPSLFAVKAAFLAGRDPYERDHITSFIRSPSSPLVVIPGATSQYKSVLILEIHYDERAARSSLWFAATRLDFDALLYHRFRDMEKKVRIAVEERVATYDNRLKSLYNQLNKVRTKEQVSSSVLDSALDGQQGLWSMISNKE